MVHRVEHDMTPQQLAVLTVVVEMLREGQGTVEAKDITARTGINNISSKLWSLEMRGFIKQQYAHPARLVVWAKFPGQSAVGGNPIEWDREFHVSRFASDLHRLQKKAIERVCLGCQRKFDAYGRFNRMCHTCNLVAADLSPFAPFVSTPDDYVTSTQAAISRHRSGYKLPGDTRLSELRGVA